MMARPEAWLERIWWKRPATSMNCSGALKPTLFLASQVAYMEARRRVISKWNFLMLLGLLEGFWWAEKGFPVEGRKVREADTASDGVGLVADVHGDGAIQEEVFVGLLRVAAKRARKQGGIHVAKLVAKG